MGVYPCYLFPDENQIQLLSPCSLKFQAVGSQLPRTVLESPSLKRFKSHVDEALGDMEQWWHFQRWELLQLMILESFSSLNSVIQ